MKRFPLAFVAILFLSAERSEAATFTASVINGACGFLVDTSDTGASLTCGTASAASGPGGLSTSVVAFDISSSTGFDRETNVRASAQLLDTLFFSGLQSGAISIPLDFAGSIELATQVPEFGVVGASAGASAGVITTGGTEIIASAGATFSTTSGFSVTGSEASITDVLFPIVNGQALVRASLGVTANCQLFSIAGGESASCRATANYGSSLRFLGATVFDEFGVERDDVLVTSESGFDYRTGVEPHSPPAAVIPLPATALMLLSSLFGLAVYRRAR